MFLITMLSLSSDINFFEPEQLFPFPVEINDVIHSLKGLNDVDITDTEIRKLPVDVNFNLDDKCCGKEEL